MSAAPSDLNKTPSRYAALAGFILAAFVAAAIGTAATLHTVRTWYPELAKPSWTPPSGLFAPVWTILYLLMSVAAWRVWRKQSGDASVAVLRSFGCQLCLNALWSVLFFGLRRPDLALIDIGALWITLVVILARFWSADRTAGVLWAPYVLWVTFAAALNAAVWHLNR